MFPTKHIGTELSQSFAWRTRTGELLRPDEMETRHLFFTLRMIWNHTMPEAAQLPEGNRYTLGPHYTREYLIEAIKSITQELATRNDMIEDWRRQLGQMLYFLGKNQIEALSAGV